MTLFDAFVFGFGLTFGILAAVAVAAISAISLSILFFIIQAIRRKGRTNAAQ